MSLAPACFPFTFVTGMTAMSMEALFGGSVVYAPSRLDLPGEVIRVSEAHGVSVRTPLEERLDLDLLRNVLSRLKTFEEMSRGLDLGSLKHMAAVPFFDETSPLHVRQDIREAAGMKKPEDRKAADMAAAVFLHVAQRMDEARHEVDSRMAKVRAREAEMFRELGDPDENAVPIPGPETTVAENANMPEQRVAAWARCALRDPELPPILACTRQEALDVLLERNPGGIHAMETGPVRVSARGTSAYRMWRKSFTACLDRLLNEGEGALDAMEDITSFEHVDKAGVTASLTVYLFPDNPPARVLSACVTDPPVPADGTKVPNTLCCLVRLVRE
ncbi:MAG: hypothetical protein ACLFOY_09765 [Desulfatibacillaceae bacterium]